MYAPILLEVDPYHPLVPPLRAACGAQDAIICIVDMEVAEQVLKLLTGAIIDHKAVLMNGMKMNAQIPRGRPPKAPA